MIKLSIYKILIALCFLPLTTNAQTVESQLIGQWQFDDATSFNELSEATQAHFDTIPASDVATMKGLYIGRMLTFNQDGTYVQELSDGRSVTARWTYNTEQNQVVITHPQGGQIKQTVAQIGGGTLLLIPVMEGMANMYIDRWYFTKQ